jgi:hypothetical protein
VRERPSSVAGAALGAALTTALLAGCAPRPAAPTTAVLAYAAAVERHDFRTAYALMSDAYRQRVSLAEFRRSLEQDAPELTADARAARASADRWGGRVEMVLPGDERVVVVREGSAWRLSDRPLDPFGQDSPRAALRAFLRAVESRRYDVLMRLAPSRVRGTLTIDKLRAFWEGEQAAQNRSLLRELRLGSAAPISEEGDEAFMTYGSNRQVHFVREEAGWRIESPE